MNTMQLIAKRNESTDCWLSVYQKKKIYIYNIHIIFIQKFEFILNTKVCLTKLVKNMLKSITFD